MASPTLPTFTESPSVPLPDSHPNDDKWATGALLIYVSLLFVILLTSYYLQSKKIRFIHETVVSIVLGLMVGLVVRLTPFSSTVTFNHKYFFNLLLPPIILNSGYDMKRKNFFRNIGSILTFALIGTMISTIIIGVLVYFVVYLLVVTHWHPELKMTMLDCIVFGSILSSTDPVTILAIFHQLRVDPKLYAIIFGESILNDSVAIVLFKVLGQFRGKEVTIVNLFHGAASFLAVFTGSVMVGIIIALIGALMLKHSRLHEFPSLESSIIALLAYSSYLLSNSVQLSGIVSLLFCGICLKHYAYNNMSIRTRRTTKYMFRVLSQLSENFVFIYLGVTVFTNLKDEVYRPGLIFFTLIICMVARYMSVIPLARLINFVSARLRPGTPREEIPRNHQLMLWWAGLRGAIAFALSFEVSGDTEETMRTARVIQTTTLIICIITVILLGGTTNMALSRLRIRTGVGKKGVNSSGLATGDDYIEDDDEDPDTDSSDGEGDDWDDDLPGSIHRDHGDSHASNESLDNVSVGSLEDLVQSDSHRGVRIDVEEDSRGRGNTIWDDDMTHWFMSFDNKWLKPLFTRTRWKWGRTGGRRRHASPSRERLLHTPAGSGEGAARTNSGTQRTFGLSPSAFENRRKELRNASKASHASGGFGPQRPIASSLRSGSAFQSFGRKPESTGKGGEEEEVFHDVNGNVWTGNRPAPKGDTSHTRSAGTVEMDGLPSGQQQQGGGLRSVRSSSRINLFTME
ncbi:sodium/hydrogen exchanger 3 [Spizellomyces punctatus DAOM BR117]|uniref:Sodium/hydrogen exchanger n=1 Tax=Spizellomyces punctatus (strain DAOM BR117) TaxID=645134 RepID=A0A0L0H929_SPIPD|nr:sodium/hydrogen exchanger 3 [Spizellomyces punctatus DAOM BR117]KNC97506.1 sodium/hydrogen exchanger 3 [Spizellomyces punctatus DAOM BR117]|eukprot:XP_016605546.1 sodium/hydrogen exchanger 3 [Spizellomyces punctatus DAOM BR117]